MPERVVETLTWEFGGNVAPLKSAFSRADSLSKQHVATVNSHLKGIGNTINIGSHFESSAKKTEKEAQAHVGRLNSIFKHAGEGLKEGIGGIFSGAMSVFGGNILTGAFQKVEQTTEKLLDMGLEHQSVWMAALKRMTAFNGSAEKADEILEKLHTLAKDRALEFAPLSEAAFKLTEIGYRGPEIVNMFKGITAQAVALGRGSEGVQRLVMMLQMMEDSGKAAGRGLMQLQRQGYQIFSTLEKITGLDKRFLSKALQRGQLDPRAVIGMITEGWEMQFGPMSEKLSQGLKDKMTRLNIVMEEQMATIIQPLTKGAGKVVDDIREVFEMAGPSLSEGLAKMLGYAVNSLTGGLDKLLNIVKDKFESHSPSQFAIRQGMWFMEGLGTGFQKGSGSAQGGLKETLETILNDQNLQKFWQALMAKGFEGTEGRDVAFGGKPYDTSRGLAGVPGTRLPSGKTTHAFGPWQEQPSTFKDAALALGLDPNDISLHNQQLVATYLLYQQKALDAILSGRFAEAIPKLTGVWTSLPGGKEAHGNTINKFIAAMQGQRHPTSPYSGVYGGVPTSSMSALAMSQEDQSKVKEWNRIITESRQKIELLNQAVTDAQKRIAGGGTAAIRAGIEITSTGGFLDQKTRLEQIIKRTESERDLYIDQLLALKRTAEFNAPRVGPANINVAPQPDAFSGFFVEVLRKKREKEVQDALESAKHPSALPRTPSELESAMAKTQPGLFRRQAIESVRPLEGMAKTQLTVEQRGLITFHAALSKLERSTIGLTEQQEQSIAKAQQNQALSEDDIESIKQVIKSNHEFSSSQKEALLVGLQKNKLDEQQITTLQKVIWKYESVGTLIRQGLEQQGAEYPTKIRQGKADIFTGAPERIGAIAYDFLTKWDLSWKSARQLLVGGLRSVVVEPLAKVFQTYVQQMVTSFLTHILGQKIAALMQDSAATAMSGAAGIQEGAGITMTAAATIMQEASDQMVVAAGLMAGSSGIQIAGGGLIKGPGTSTSDSIPAWLSNGEYVIRANSVKKYGSAFFDRLNEGQMFPRFAQGGETSSNWHPVAPVMMQGNNKERETKSITINLNAPIVGGSSYSSPKSKREYIQMLEGAVKQMLAA